MLIATLDWRWIFFINVPLGLIVVVAALVRIPATPTTRASFDVAGTLSAVLCLGSLTIALIEGGQLGWTATPVLSCFALAVLTFLLTAHRKRRKGTDAADRRSAMFTQDSLKTTPLTAGLMFLPMTIGVTAAHLFIGPRLDRMGTRLPLVVGQALCACGYFALSRIPPTTAYAPLGAIFPTVGRRRPHRSRHDDRDA